MAMPAFHNVEPRTREQRIAAQNKDMTEKNMLRSRKGNYHRYAEPGNPLVPEPVSPMYADSCDRFNRDYAGELHHWKEQQHRKQQVW
jgi:hypothetical protein